MWYHCAMIASLNSCTTKVIIGNTGNLLFWKSGWTFVRPLPRLVKRIKKKRSLPKISYCPGGVFCVPLFCKSWLIFQVFEFPKLQKEIYVLTRSFNQNFGLYPWSIFRNILILKMKVLFSLNSIIKCHLISLWTSNYRNFQNNFQSIVVITLKLFTRSRVILKREKLRLVVSGEPRVR